MCREVSISNDGFGGVSLTSKVSDSWIRDLMFNPRLHQKPITVLIWW